MEFCFFFILLRFLLKTETCLSPQNPCIFIGHRSQRFMFDLLLCIVAFGIPFEQQSTIKRWIKLGKGTDRNNDFRHLISIPFLLGIEFDWTQDLCILHTTTLWNAHKNALAIYPIEYCYRWSYARARGRSRAYENNG